MTVQESIQKINHLLQKACPPGLGDSNVLRVLLTRVLNGDNIEKDLIDRCYLYTLGLTEARRIFKSYRGKKKAVCIPIFSGERFNGKIRYTPSFNSWFNDSTSALNLIDHVLIMRWPCAVVGAENIKVHTYFSHAEFKVSKYHGILPFIRLVEGAQKRVDKHYKNQDINSSALDTLEGMLKIIGNGSGTKLRSIMNMPEAKANKPDNSAGSFKAVAVSYDNSSSSSGELESSEPAEHYGEWDDDIRF